LSLLAIQRFVFASNRMRDVVGASALIRRASSTEGVVAELNVDPATVIVAAGGRMTLRFNDIDAARTFAALYTQWLARTVPGIEIALIHREYDSGMAEALRRASEDLDRAVLNRTPSAPLLGLAVTAVCRETGLPAAEQDDRGPIAESVVAARRERPRARQRWEPFAPSLPQVRFAFPADIDGLGRTRGATSLVGIVHLDGNGVGAKIRAFLQRCAIEHLSDDAVLTMFKTASRALERMGEVAVQAIADRLVASCSVGEDGKVRIQGRNPELIFELADDDTHAYLPFVPILLGGDDLTFVADGRIALDLAESALQAYESAPAVGPLGRIGACAGVALVGSHAPFYRAYRVAEALCDSAKRKVAGLDAGYAIDWHIGEARPSETIDEMRSRRYTANGQKLTARPYALGTADQSLTWRWLNERVLTGFIESPWAERRRKVRALPPILREGASAVRKNLQAWRVVDRNLAFPAQIPDSGFIDGATPLLDANELLDLHLGLTFRAPAADA
jgi:hypothetical protein